jgi:hypothetical protein
MTTPSSLAAAVATLSAVCSHPGGRSARAVRLPQRLFQCPGCWMHLVTGKPDSGWVECDCGERMTLIDLRERRSRPLNEDES